MISLGPRDAEEPFFEHFIILVPEGKSKAETLVIIADACNAIFSPSVRPRARMLVRKVSPGVAIPRVVFPDGGLDNERHGTSETKKKKQEGKKKNEPIVYQKRRDPIVSNVSPAYRLDRDDTARWSYKQRPIVVEASRDKIVDLSRRTRRVIQSTLGASLSSAGGSAGECQSWGWIWSEGYLVFVSLCLGSQKSLIQTIFVVCCGR